MVETRPIEGGLELTARERQQHQLIKKLERDTGLSFKGGQLAKLAELLGFKNVEQLHNYLYKARPQSLKVKPEDQEKYGEKLARAHGALFKEGMDLLRVIAGLSPVIVDGNSVTRFGFILKPGQDGNLRLYGFEVVTDSGETVSLTNEVTAVSGPKGELKAFLEKFNPDGTLKEGMALTAREAKIFKVLGEKGVAALKKSLPAVAKAVGGSQPPGGFAEELPESSVMDDSWTGGVGVNGLSFNNLNAEAIRIILDGFKEISDSISAYVKAEIDETNRIMKETEEMLRKAQEENNKEEAARLKRKLEVLRHIVEVKKAIEDFRAALNTGDLTKIRAALDKLKSIVTASVTFFKNEKADLKEKGIFSEEELGELEKTMGKLKGVQRQLEIVDRFITALEGGKDIKSLREELDKIKEELASYIDDSKLGGAELGMVQAIQKEFTRMDFQLKSKEMAHQIEEEMRMKGPVKPLEQIGR